MRREEAISTLRGYLPALRRDFGVRRIALFGSTARDEARENHLPADAQAKAPEIPWRLVTEMRNLLAQATSAGRS